MPSDLKLSFMGRDSPGRHVVQFNTRNRKVFGTSYCTNKYDDETDYNVLEAKLLTGQQPKPGPSIVQSKPAVGTFSVVGQVNFFFDDVVFVVEAHGFDFWVGPDQIEKPVHMGDWVHLEISDFTLVAHELNTSPPVAKPGAVGQTAAARYCECN